MSCYGQSHKRIDRAADIFNLRQKGKNACELARHDWFCLTSEFVHEASLLDFFNQPEENLNKTNQTRTAFSTQLKLVLKG